MAVVVCRRRGWGSPSRPICGGCFVEGRIRCLSSILGAPVILGGSSRRVLATFFDTGYEQVVCISALIVGKALQGYAMEWAARQIERREPGFRVYRLTDITVSEVLGRR